MRFSILGCKTFYLMARSVKNKMIFNENVMQQSLSSKIEAPGSRFVNRHDTSGPRLPAEYNFHQTWTPADSCQSFATQAERRRALQELLPGFPLLVSMNFWYIYG